MENSLTIGGWILLIGSLSFVWGLAGWCYYRILTGGSEEQSGDD